MLAEASYWITWFPGALLATFGFLALVWKGVEWLVTAKGTLKQVQLALPKIEAEFSPNGGGSMKDRVESLHGKVERLSEDTHRWQSKHARDDDRRFERLDAGLERIEDKLSP